MAVDGVNIYLSDMGQDRIMLPGSDRLNRRVMEPWAAPAGDTRSHSELTTKE